MDKPDNTQQPELDDPRVLAALDEYQAALDAGYRPNRREFLAHHADVAGPLAECLEGLEALHEASSASGSLPAGPAAGDWQPGASLGDFRIVREVGRGGMGIVYEAEQISLGRRIALKVLPFALTLDPRQLQRFKNEARAAAQLHHQHIVPVYSVGSERGVHFYAMQYIDGQSLAEVVHELRQQARPAAAPAAPSAPARAASTGPYLVRPGGIAAETIVRPLAALATAFSADGAGFYRSAARLGVQAAEALEHAHEYGVVHRDVKPGNLLVDAHGHLWITDFGLAQFQTDAGLTQSGDLLGTLRYMSPEQAGGQRTPLDHRTDIYSLGATLYELLTLRPPFEGGDRQTLLRQILHDEPRPPRAVRKSVPVELETIVLKAMAKVPSERYATARELADDLTRFLDNQPIRARRATPAQRLRKWGRRHPAVVWAGVVLCVLTAAGSLVSAEMIHREQQKTEAAYQQERQRAREAEDRFVLARQAVDDMFNLCEVELADKPYLDGLRRRMLEEFLVYYQRLMDQRRDDPNAQAQLSASRGRVRKILADLALLQGVWQLKLLRESAVLDDLHVQEGQRTELEDLTREMDRRLWEVIGRSNRLPPDERRQPMIDLAREHEARVNAVLTPSQRRRLRQIDLQRKGVRAFDEYDVAAVLKLTAPQKERIRAIQAETAPPGPFGGWQPGGPGHHEPGKFGKGKPPAPPEQAMDRVKHDVLTAEQRQRWRDLTGEPFKTPPSPPPFDRRVPHR